MAQAETSVPAAESAARPKYPDMNEWRHWPRSQKIEFALEVLVDAVEHDHNRALHSDRIRTATRTAHLALDEAGAGEGGS